jgi:hypothetical protein
LFGFLQFFCRFASCNSICQRVDPHQCSAMAYCMASWEDMRVVYSMVVLLTAGWLVSP